MGRGAPTGFRGGRGGGPGASRPQELHELTPEQIGMIKNKLRGMKVGCCLAESTIAADKIQFTVTHRQSTRLHTVMSITLQAAKDISFVMEDKKTGENKKFFIPDYYKQYCQAEVTKPRLPCIQVSQFVLSFADEFKLTVTSMARKTLSRSNLSIWRIGIRFRPPSYQRTRLPSELLDYPVANTQTDWSV